MANLASVWGTSDISMKLMTAQYYTGHILYCMICTIGMDGQVFCPDLIFIHK